MIPRDLLLYFFTLCSSPSRGGEVRGPYPAQELCRRIFTPGRSNQAGIVKGEGPV